MRVLLLASLISLTSSAYGAAKATPAAAMPAASQSLMVTPAPVAPKASKISGMGTLTRSNSLYVVNGNTQVASWDFMALVGYKLNDTYKLSAQMDASQDLVDPRTSDLTRGRFLLKRDGGKIFAGRSLFAQTLKLALPVSRSHYSDTFQGSLGLDLALDANPDALIWKKLKLGVTVYGTQNFHKFQTSTSGAVNTRNSLGQSFRTGWAFTDAFDLSLSFDHISTWSYLGGVKEYYAHSQELGYAATKSIGLSLGHAYGVPYASVLKANQKDYNYNLTDEQNSTVYGTVSYTF